VEPRRRALEWLCQLARLHLPAPQSELARQILKDPYNFDFLTLGKEAQERDLEAALLFHMREF